MDGRCTCTPVSKMDGDGCPSQRWMEGGIHLWARHITTTVATPYSPTTTRTTCWMCECCNCNIFKLDYTRRARVARRALVQPPFNFSSASMWRDPTFKQLKTWDFAWFCTVQTSPVCEKITSLSISSSVIFLSTFFKNTFSSMVPLLQKLSFFWSIFDSLRFDTVYKHSKRVSRVRVFVGETLKKSGRTDGRTSKIKRRLHKSPAGNNYSRHQWLRAAADGSGEFVGARMMFLSLLDIPGPKETVLRPQNLSRSHSQPF